MSQETFIFLMTDDIASVFYATENEPVERGKTDKCGREKITEVKSLSKRQEMGS